MCVITGLNNSFFFSPLTNDLFVFNNAFRYVFFKLCQIHIHFAIKTNKNTNKKTMHHKNNILFKRNACNKCFIKTLFKKLRKE